MTTKKYATTISIDEIVRLTTKDDALKSRIYLNQCIIYISSAANGQRANIRGAQYDYVYGLSFVVSLLFCRPLSATIVDRSLQPMIPTRNMRHKRDMV